MKRVCKSWGRGGGGGRYLSGRKLDPIRNDFELIKTPENMGKSPQQQQVRCKACAECVSARLERMWEHKDRCRNYFNVIFRITRCVILKNWSYWTKLQRGYNCIAIYSHYPTWNCIAIQLHYPTWTLKLMYFILFHYCYCYYYQFHTML